MSPSFDKINGDILPRRYTQDAEYGAAPSMARRAFVTAIYLPVASVKSR